MKLTGEAKNETIEESCKKKKKKGKGKEGKKTPPTIRSIADGYTERAGVTEDGRKHKAEAEQRSEGYQHPRESLARRKSMSKAVASGLISQYQGLGPKSTEKW